ncbi:MAG: hypothetical protein M0Q40_01230 [Limnochordia bacterium]|nr:hypothetical protein [Limnochordia bacterium]
MTEKWSREKAWDWYQSRPWIVGCNFIPSTCINVVEIWQEYNFDEVIRVIERELAIAAATGINSVRMVLPFFVWKYQRDGFKTRMEQFLVLAHRQNISMLPVFFDDCGCGPKESFREPRFGPQPAPWPGSHGGGRPASREVQGAPWHLFDDQANWGVLEDFVKDMVGTFGQDERILAWDIWNEPGNSGRRSASKEAMEAVFGWAREMRPIQPLTAGPWEFYGDYFQQHQPGYLSEIEERAVELSDIFSFHFYGDLVHTKLLIDAFRVYDRPMLITEWLHRPFGNLVETHLPLFGKERIGCFHWGLVNGKTQTHEPWDWIRGMDLDFSLWQHDLYLGDGTPYRVEEIHLFQQLTGVADSVGGDSSEGRL